MTSFVLNTYISANGSLLIHVTGGGGGGGMRLTEDQSVLSGFGSSSTYIEYQL